MPIPDVYEDTPVTVEASGMLAKAYGCFHDAKGEGGQHEGGEASRLLEKVYECSDSDGSEGEEREGGANDDEGEGEGDGDEEPRWCGEATQALMSFRNQTVIDRDNRSRAVD